eukprot:COSAG02_NODE_6408_length_3593_cov_2.949914_3_plen_94_part_00
MLYVVTRTAHEVPLSIYTPSPATLRLLLTCDSDRPYVHARARGRLIAACTLSLSSTIPYQYTIPVLYPYWYLHYTGMYYTYTGTYTIQVHPIH